MAHEFKLSEFGLKLIKAYEGFRSVETTLVSGQQVIGYGHKISPGEEQAVTRAQAEDLLKDDLAPYQALINENVFAPLAQSQFDALVSLAFNIGPRAFLNSNIVHALNNGRPLEAANGFDEWRKSVISGKTYVVDALVRRRTAEKSLFLRPSVGIVAASRHELPPKPDLDYRRDEGSVPEFIGDNKGIVDMAPYAAQVTKFRCKDDGPVGVLTLKELANDDVEYTDIDPPQSLPANPETKFETLHEERGTGLSPITSPIAVAAAQVSDRLDKLIAVGCDEPVQDTDSPFIEDTLEEPLKHPLKDPLVPQTMPHMEEKPLAKPLAANEGTHEDFQRRETREKPVVRSLDRFIQKTKSAPAPAPVPAPKKSYEGYWTTLIVGAALLGSGLVKWIIKPSEIAGGWSAFLATISTIVGAMMVLAALYYMFKTLLRKS